MEPGPVFVPALNQLHQPLSSSLSSRLFSLPPPLPLAPVRFPVLLSSSVAASAAGSNPLRLQTTQTFYHFDFNGTFPITTTPVRFTRPEVHTLPTFPERRSSWPQRDGRSTTFPRSSTITRPPLSHTHSLSLYLSFSFSRPSWPSPCPSTRPLRHFHHRRLGSPTLCPLSLVLVAPTISVFLTDITSTPFYVSLSPSRLSNYRQTVSFHYTDVVSSVERNLPLALTHGVTRQLSSLRRTSFGRSF